MSPDAIQVFQREYGDVLWPPKPIEYPRVAAAGRNALKQQLAQAQRLTALGELVSTTTHEFNNVLMTILNYAKMGMRHKDAATRDKCFDKILASANRAATITNTVLGMARNRSAGQEPTDLAKLVDDTLLLLEREMNKYRVTVEKSFQPIPPAYGQRQPDSAGAA